ncbi:drug/metabolite transporter (DMT)-like permease [Rhizobium sp. BK313]|uniref:DMT family transporter n=1 Tax=Rhizobium sp. BK313 TaxID=2587081 RepID=UPI00105C27FC|nr:DMT family transporter [Rhizobium sp. BK313]MBB3457024.1 drug/metabolite transporter (DMT)-like permease [Rhizobium sp. BK313]
MKNPVSYGILLTVFAYMLFTAHDSVVKLLVVTIPVWQILFWRSCTILAGCFIFEGPSLAQKVARSPIIKPMIVRSILLVVAWTSYYSAARYLQLAEVTTLYYAAPIVGTILATIVLREKVTVARWMAVGVGFCGVVIASNPVGLSISWPVYLALQAAVLWATGMVLLRKTALHEKSHIQMAVSNIIFILLTGTMAILHWKTPTTYELVLLFSTGAIAGVAQLALFEGMRQAPVSVLAPFEYTSLVWAFLLGFLIWGDIPKINTFVGAVLILGAGLIIIVSERLRRVPAALTKQDHDRAERSPVPHSGE